VLDSFEVAPDVNIKVVGVGGAGGNAINHMIASGVQGVEFWAINTDVQALQGNQAEHRLQIGHKVTKGRGVGGDPTLGGKAADENRDDIMAALDGAEMVFITAGMGGGTGTGAAPIVAEVAKEIGALTVGVVTKPFLMEGRRREKAAREGIERLMERVDTLIVIPNERLIQECGNKMLFEGAFKTADDLLRQGVQGISDIITIRGYINVDFADIRTVMSNAGTALMGIGVASGEGRAVEAARMAVASPLLETSFKGATGVIFNIRGSQEELTLHEVNEAMKIVHDEASDDANIIFGTVFDEKLAGQVHVTVIATGFDSANGRAPQSAHRSVQIESPAAAAAEHLLRPAVAPAGNHGGADDLPTELPPFLRNTIRPR
jgi:cell division protein FtsZ